MALISPVILLFGGQLLVRALEPRFGSWTWLPFSLVYWTVVVGFAWLVVGRRALARWLGPGRSGAVGWKVASVAVALAPAATLLLQEAAVLLSPTILAASLLFVLVNPLAEEIYWRGLLLDAADFLPPWVALGFSSVLFMLHHLWLNPVIPGGQTIEAIGGALVLGLLWGATYQRTGSLRWPLLGHVLVNGAALPVPVMMGIVTP